MSRLKEQLDFIVEIDKLKEITRQSYITNGKRKENDAEHSWHLAVMAIFLAEYSKYDIDVLQVVKMVLIHDLVEIDAGDTYLYDTEGYKTKEKREKQAAERIFRLLPQDQADELFALWREFEERETKESKFANTLDRVQPVLLNDASDGKAWKEHDVYLDQILGMNNYTKDGSDILWEELVEIFDRNIECGNIKSPANKCQ